MKNLKSIVGPFESNKKEINDFFQNKFNMLLSEVKADHLSEELFNDLDQLNEVSIILVNFKSTPEELAEIERRSLIKRKAALRSNFGLQK